jgi:4'-phosphopantetheinyl transferase
LLALADGAPAPFFSLSHSGRWVACALSADTPLGLDIEMLDSGRDVLALAAQAFGAGAASRLAALPPAARSGAFYRLWSEREALYKLGDCPAPACVSLAHADLSIVLCSAQPLAAIEREYGLPSPRPG